MYKEDTIAAISTAHGTGGIGIIRISGEKAFEIAEALFKGKKPFSQIKSHTLNYGKMLDPRDGTTIDEILLSKMKRPNTFTREDVVEINCHGGIVVLKTILEQVVKQGARLAEPGEFTQRAFMNGRIDLSQAEAVIDLIHAKTLESSKAAVTQLEGKLSKVLKSVRSKLIELIAHIEVTVDYPEDDIEEITGQKVISEITEIREKLEDIIRGFEKGRVIREGINVVIAGRPNVGKSSLLNELVGKNKAIVTDIPGTTRDIIEEYININGIPVRIIDTAGLRETTDVVEKIGVEKAEKALEIADLVIVMIDASQGINQEDHRIIEKTKDKNKIILVNKIDLVNEKIIHNIENEMEEKNIIQTSIEKGVGIQALENRITEMFLKGKIDVNNELLITNIRHKELIDKALKSIHEACIAHNSEMPLDCIAIDIKNSAEYIGEITGESVREDVMKQIFSRFCLGK